MAKYRQIIHRRRNRQTSCAESPHFLLHICTNASFITYTNVVPTTGTGEIIRRPICVVISVTKILQLTTRYAETTPPPLPSFQLPWRRPPPLFHQIRKRRKIKQLLSTDGIDVRRANQQNPPTRLDPGCCATELVTSEIPCTTTTMRRTKMTCPCDELFLFSMRGRPRPQNKSPLPFPPRWETRLIGSS